MKSGDEDGVEDDLFSDWGDIWRFSRGHDGTESMKFTLLARLPTTSPLNIDRLTGDVRN